MDNMKLKSLLVSANSIQEADRILSEETNFCTFAEKKAFLEGLCNCEPPDINELIYWHLLENLISSFKAL